MSAAPPLARRSDPDTSHNAARLATGRISLKQAVRAILEDHPFGATDWEIWEATGLGIEHKPSVVNRRRECGAFDTFMRRPSPTGNPCVVWCLK
jgi:hypothetical protein